MYDISTRMCLDFNFIFHLSKYIQSSHGFTIFIPATNPGRLDVPLGVAPFGSVGVHPTWHFHAFPASMGQVWGNEYGQLPVTSVSFHTVTGVDGDRQVEGTVAF